jgi:hypothetical protein
LWEASQVARFVVGTGAGVGVYGVTECDTGGVWGVGGVVGDALFSSPISGDKIPSSVAAITRDVSSVALSSIVATE